MPLIDSIKSLFVAWAFAAIKGPVEEFGWRGLALPLLQRKFAPFWASLILGGIWGFWHLPVDFNRLYRPQRGHGFSGQKKPTPGEGLVSFLGGKSSFSDFGLSCCNLLAKTTPKSRFENNP
jgi:membrane protease YdiL (CAAX protease family)